MRRIINVTILIFTLTAGIGAAAGLLTLGVQGSIWQSVTAVIGISGFVGSMLSLQFAIYLLLVLGIVEGVYKTVFPSFFTLAAKDIMLVFIVVRLTYMSIRARDFSWFNQRISVPISLFIGYAASMITAPSTRSFMLALAGVRSWILWIPLYYPVYAAFDSREKVLRLLHSLVGISIPLAIYGIYQNVMGYEHLQAIEELYEHTLWYKGRAISVFNAPALFGNFCALVALLSLGLTFYYRAFTARVFFMAAAALATSGVAASGTRGAFLGLITGLVTFLLLARRKTFIFICIGVAALVSFNYVVPETDPGAERIRETTSLSIVVDRVVTPFGRAMKQLNEYPLGYGVATGSGSGRIFGELRAVGRAQERPWIESEIGRALFELGLPGTFFWVWTLAIAVRGTLRAARTAPDDRDHYIFTAMAACMFIILSQLLIGGALYDAAAGIYFWVFAAIAARLPKVFEEQRAAEEAAKAEAEARQQIGPKALTAGH